MAKEILRTTTEYSIDDESELDALLEEEAASGGEITKKTVERKQKKSKGEVIAEKYKVTVQVTHAGIFDDLEIGGGE